MNGIELHARDDGVPAPFVFLMRLMPQLWSKLKAVGHSLPYDAVMGEFTVPASASAR